MGAKLNKFIKENIDTYFSDNADGTVTVNFGSSPITLGSSSANFLKQIITKKLNGTKNLVSPPGSAVDMVDSLNKIATTMIKQTGLTANQKKSLEVDTMVKKIK